MKTRNGIAALAALAALCTGCAKDISIDFEVLSFPDGNPEISVEFSQIRLEEGLAVPVIARPLDNSERMDWETQVELIPAGGGAFRVERMDWDEDREESRGMKVRDGDWNFMLWGTATGQGIIELYIDGDFETEIPVFVNPQPSTN